MTISSKEWGVIVTTMEALAQHMYRRGFEDCREKRPSQEAQLKMKPAHVLRLKTEMERATKTR